ncbi:MULTISPECIES: hypothetical protein [Metallosphaera]|uniref:hypothetical protein n=1 Tax=Metallosphaera TaxID=41980 RepID=UPI0020BDB4D5|nr:hypothetical protein [Metallosphaera sedula]MCP6729634.1 hypothetical protein [Metallosphaera sedula]BBL46499.1 HEPN domain-containing protein [Metallosphaera sedula]
MVPNLKEEISSLVKAKRKDLNQVEISRFEGQYAPVDVDEDISRDCLDTLEKDLIPLIKKVWGDKWCGD